MRRATSDVRGDITAFDLRMSPDACRMSVAHVACPKSPLPPPTPRRVVFWWGACDVRQATCAATLRLFDLRMSHVACRKSVALVAYRLSHVQNPPFPPPAAPPTTKGAALLPRPSCVPLAFAFGLILQLLLLCRSRKLHYDLVELLGRIGGRSNGRERL